MNNFDYLQLTILIMLIVVNIFILSIVVANIIKIKENIDNIYSYFKKTTCFYKDLSDNLKSQSIYERELIKALRKGVKISLTKFHFKKKEVENFDIKL